MSNAYNFMSINTAREKVLEENFIEDIRKIAKQIIATIKTDLPENVEIGYKNAYRGAAILYGPHGVILLQKTVISANEKKWAILLNTNRFMVDIKVSDREEYTKSDLERAKKQILTKIYELLKL